MKNPGNARNGNARHADRTGTLVTAGAPGAIPLFSAAQFFRKPRRVRTAVDCSNRINSLSGELPSTAIQNPYRFCAAVHSFRAAMSRSPLQHINWLRKVRHPDVFGQRGMLSLEGLIHLPRHAAIAEVAGRA
jgi:hypothetical protein